MKFTELTVTEFDNFVQNPSLESHYFQVKENIVTRENDGFEVVLLGIKDDNNKVIAASLFSKILLWKLCLLFESWSSNGFFRFRIS